MEAERIRSQAEEMLKHAKMMMNQAETAFNHAEMMLDVTTKNSSKSKKRKNLTENNDVTPVEDILKESKTMLTQGEERLKGKRSDVYIL